MDLVRHDRASIIAEEEEDRISKLPDNIIHHILSFLDMKYAVQTSKLSRRWKRIWTSMPCLNLSIYSFRSMARFGKFVKRVLSIRNNHSQVSTVNFNYRGNPDLSLVNNFVEYVYSHNVKRMTFTWLSKDIHLFPQRVFSSHTLKHLTIRYNGNYACYSVKSNSSWDFPALETLNLTRLQLGEYEDKSVDLFSKCVNLKDLTLHQCYMLSLGIFNVCAPQLLNLTVTRCVIFPKVFNVVASQLKNFMASVISQIDFLRLSTEGFDSLEKVNLSIFIHNNERNIQQPLNLFQQLRTAKFLTLDASIIEFLSSCLDKLSHIPCPFKNLRCLKIDMQLPSWIYDWDHIAKIAPQVKNYLLENSPNATFIMDLPQVSPTGLKRPMQEVNNNTMANTVAKLDVPTVEPSSVAKPSSSDSDAPNLLLLMEIAREQVSNDVKKMVNLEVPPMRLKRPMQTMHNDTMANKMAKLDGPTAELPSTSRPSSSDVPPMGVKRPMQTVHSDTIANKMAKLDVPSAPIPSSSNVPRISMQEVHNNATRANLEAVEKQLETIPEDKIMLLEAKIQMQEEVMAKQKAMFEAKIKMQDEVMAKQKAMLEAKIHMQDEVVAKQKKMHETKVQMQDEVMAKQKAMLEAKIHMQDEVVAKQKKMHETKVQMQDEVIAKQKATFEAKIHMQDEIVAKQKEMLETKIQMQDEVIAKQKATFESKAHMQDEVIAKQKAIFELKTQMQDEIKSKQKAMFEAKIEMQNEVIAEQKVKVQMQDEVIANQKATIDGKVQMLEAAKSQHEELISRIINWKIAELKVQVESGNPDYEIIRSIGGDIKSVIGLIPESLKVVMKAQFSFQYVELKSLLFTRINASEWAKIESELGSNI